jgi:DNA-directed RNA polymerase subunit RPC12/RpoP
VYMCVDCKTAIEADARRSGARCGAQLPDR